MKINKIKVDVIGERFIIDDTRVRYYITNMNSRYVTIKFDWNDIFLSESTCMNLITYLKTMYRVGDGKYGRYIESYKYETQAIESDGMYLVVKLYFNQPEQ